MKGSGCAVTHTRHAPTICRFGHVGQTARCGLLGNAGPVSRLGFESRKPCFCYFVQQILARAAALGNGIRCTEGEHGTTNGHSGFHNRIRVLREGTHDECATAMGYGFVFHVDDGGRCVHGADRITPRVGCTAALTQGWQYESAWSQGARLGRGRIDGWAQGPVLGSQAP